MLNLGGFKFLSHHINSIEKINDYGISSSDRLNNYKAFFSTYRGGESLKLECKTLPFRKDGNSALDLLYSLAELRVSYPLVSGVGEYLGKYIILNITQNVRVFDRSGRFFYQNFRLELERDYDTI